MKPSGESLVTNKGGEYFFALDQAFRPLAHAANQPMHKTKHFGGPNEIRPFAHMFFFQLYDTSSDLVERFISLCEFYLSGHPGQEHFSVGVRALEINRDVSGTNFEVSVHMIFKDIAAYNVYSNSADHEKFITESAGMSPVRIVYDSYLRLSVPPQDQKP